MTVILLSGMGLHFIAEACGLARLVEPAMVVLEDVDLVAESRSFRPGLDNPLLFQVLNEMEGLAGDADVAFLLTTNRIDCSSRRSPSAPAGSTWRSRFPFPARKAATSCCACTGTACG